MKHPQPQTLIFDWDNTLVDTWDTIHYALSVTFEAMGMRPWTLEETKVRVRRSAREAFPELFGARSEAAAEVFYETFAREHLALLRAAPGAEEMLKALAAAGYDMAVVSNKNGVYLRREVAQLDWERHFRVLVGATDAARDKPALEAVQLALRDRPSSAEAGPAVWFIGDTDIDLVCAHNSGCYPVLLRPQPPYDGEFEEAPPALHLDSCTALAQLLLNTP